jgi:hypothetical protein
MQLVPVEVVLMQKYHKAILVELEVLHLDNLAGFKEHHGAGLMIVPGAAIQHHAGFKLLKPDHIKIAGELAVAHTAGVGAPVNAQQRAFRWREAIIAVQFGEVFIVLHDACI